MNIEQILALPLAETFVLEGVAPNVVAAHNMAWDGFTSLLLDDPVAAWTMKVMQHAYMPDGPNGSPAVQFHAEFARNPSFEIEESS